MSSLQWGIKRGDEAESWIYLIVSEIFCKLAYKLIFKILNSKVDRLQHLHNPSPRVEREGKVIDCSTMDVLIWLQEVFNNNGQQHPNKNFILLPTNYSKEEVWKLCEAHLGCSSEKLIWCYGYFTKL